MFKARSAINLKSLSFEKVFEIFDSIDTVLSDCDGVLWMHMTPLPNSPEVMNIFSDLGKKVFFVTNNSTKTRSEFVEKCKALNFKAVENNILCTSHLAASYLNNISFKRQVYVIGSSGIAKELESFGISYSGIGPDNFTSMGDLTSFKKNSEIGAVIVGYDEYFSYPKMLKAATYLAKKDVLFIGTNTDEQFPTAENVIIPGTGSLVRCVETCANRKAVIVGKPESYISNLLKNKYDVSPKSTIMIGDRANSDILLGTRCGFKTLLVLSGVTTIEEVKSWEHSKEQDDQMLVPDYYIDTLGDLLPYLTKYKEIKEK